MHWVLKTLVGAVVGGLGWKVGSEAYEALKKYFSQKEKKVEKKVETKKEQESDGAGAVQTGAAPTAESGSV